jgi:hypothetical protein
VTVASGRLGLALQRFKSDAESAWRQASRASRCPAGGSARPGRGRRAEAEGERRAEPGGRADGWLATRGLRPACIVSADTVGHHMLLILAGPRLCVTGDFSWAPVGLPPSRCLGVRPMRRHLQVRRAKPCRRRSWRSASCRSDGGRRVPRSPTRFVSVAFVRGSRIVSLGTAQVDARRARGVWSAWLRAGLKRLGAATKFGLWMARPAGLPSVGSDSLSLRWLPRWCWASPSCRHGGPNGR